MNEIFNNKQQNRMKILWLPKAGTVIRC